MSLSIAWELCGFSNGKERPYALARTARIRTKPALQSVELLIAMAILALGVLAATSIQMGTARNNSKGNIYTQAYMLAIERLEILKNQDVSFARSGSLQRCIANRRKRPAGRNLHAQLDH